MTQQDIVAFLTSKAGWRVDDEIKKAYENCASYLLAYKGVGGGTVYHFDGKMVKHVTENRGEVTFFFTYSGDSKIASIIGIGEHTGKKSATAEYELKWKIKRWVVRNSKGEVVNKVKLQWSGTLPEKGVQSVRQRVLDRT
jgi:hypothetical protein